MGNNSLVIKLVTCNTAIKHAHKAKIKAGSDLPPVNAILWLEEDNFMLYIYAFNIYLHIVMNSG